MTIRNSVKTAVKRHLLFQRYILPHNVCNRRILYSVYLLLVTELLAIICATCNAIQFGGGSVTLPHQNDAMLRAFVHWY